MKEILDADKAYSVLQQNWKMLEITAMERIYYIFISNRF